jgi:hypothetical protein
LAARNAATPGHGCRPSARGEPTAQPETCRARMRGTGVCGFDQAGRQGRRNTVGGRQDKEGAFKKAAAIMRGRQASKVTPAYGRRHVLCGGRASCAASMTFDYCGFDNGLRALATVRSMSIVVYSYTCLRIVLLGCQLCVR